MIDDRSEVFAYRVNPFDFAQARALRVAPPVPPRAALKRSAPLPMLVAPLFTTAADARALRVVADRGAAELEWADREALELDAIALERSATPEESRLEWIDACDAEARANADSDAPEVVGIRYVEKTRLWHFCHVCRGDIPPHSPAEVRTLKVGGTVTAAYVCDSCDHPSRGTGGTTAERYGTHLHDESDGGPIDRTHGAGRKRKLDRYGRAVL